MDKAQPIITLALKAVALAMAVASVVLSIVGEAPVGTNVLLLGIGLFALSVAALQKTKGLD